MKPDIIIDSPKPEEPDEEDGLANVIVGLKHMQLTPLERQNMTNMIYAARNVTVLKVLKILRSHNTIYIPVMNEIKDLMKDRA